MAASKAQPSKFGWTFRESGPISPNVNLGLRLTKLYLTNYNIKN